MPAEGGTAFPLTPHHEALSRLFMPPRKTCGVPAHSTRHRSVAAHPHSAGPISGDRVAGVRGWVQPGFSGGLGWRSPVSARLGGRSYEMDGSK